MLKTEHLDDKLFFISRRPLISKQTSMVDPNRPPKLSSSRVYTYYGGVSVGVPFLWESKPGTPIHSSSVHNKSSSFFPPLNPPPCYNNRNPPPVKMRSKSFSLRSIFPIKLPFRSKSRRSDFGPAPESLSSSSSSSASSVPSSPVIRHLANFRRSQSTSIGHTKSGFDYDFDDDNSIISRGSSTARCFWH